MLTLDHITKKYGDKVALDDVSLVFPDKGLVVICGESGCGKTTLLNVASGADTPSSGKVFWRGCELTASNADALRRGYAADVYQDFMLADELSASENIRLAAEACGKRLSDSDISALLARVGLGEEFFSKRVSLLSGGEKQRVAVARALVKDGAIVFADEPTGSLDRKNGEIVMSLLRDIARERLVLVVSHNERLNREYGQYSVVLEDGRVISSDLPQDEGRHDAVLSAADVPAPRLSPRTALRLASAGYEKNKIKCVFAAIAFVLVFALSALANTLFIADLPFALASSLNSAAAKNVLVTPLSSDSGDPQNFLELRDDASAVYSYWFQLDPLDDDPLPVVPQFVYAITYDPAVDADVDVVYGSFPSAPNEVMVSTLAAQALLRTELADDCGSMEELIGKFLPVSTKYPMYSADSLSFGYKICGVFDQRVPHNDFMSSSLIADEDFLRYMMLYRYWRNTSAFDAAVDGSSVTGVVPFGFDNCAEYASALDEPGADEVLLGADAAEVLGIDAGDVFVLTYDVYSSSLTGSLSLSVAEVLPRTGDYFVDRGMIFAQDVFFERFCPLTVSDAIVGYYFNFADVADPYTTLLSIQNDLQSVFGSDRSSGEGMLYRRAQLQNLSNEFYNRYRYIYEARYIAFLPAATAFAVGLVCTGAAFFGFLLSSKSRTFGIMRALGLGKKNVFAVMALQQALLALTVIALGLTAAGVICFAVSGALAPDPLCNEYTFPLGWHAGLIAALTTAVTAIAAAGVKTSRLFSVTVAHEKSH